MYRHKKIYELRYTDVDAYDVIKPSSLLSFLEESACLSADELGFGYKDVAPKNKGFIIANWYIELSRPIKLGDKLEVHTWPIRPRLLIFFRDYELFVNGEKVGVATARWCMIDSETFAVLPASAYFKEEDFENYNTERSIDFKAWKIPAIDGGIAVYKKQVTYSDYDHYFHVNNTKYADFLSDAFTVGEFNGRYIKKLQITYVKQCRIGEEIEIVRKDTDGATLVEGKVGGEVRVQFKVAFDEV
jgi:YbgC/YbaW family acyl-CoA thioester hydrolase